MVIGQGIVSSRTTERGANEQDFAMRLQLSPRANQNVNLPNIRLNDASRHRDREHTPTAAARQQTNRQRTTRAPKVTGGSIAEQANIF